MLFIWKVNGGISLSVIINVDELSEKVQNHQEKMIIIDVRTKSEQFSTGRKAYEFSHLPQALYLDFKDDLSGNNSFLPNVEQLAEKLGDLGVSNDATIVLYDQGNHRAASKAWFILKYLGHAKVYILNGGYSAWVEAGYEVLTEIPKLQPTTYTVKLDESFIVDIEHVKHQVSNESSVHIDSRANERYTGEVEPKYKKAGHIPGAKNFHSKLAFNQKGLWKDKGALNEHFASLKEKDEIIVSCGSGNSACMNVVALKEAGFRNVKLYPGGFSEWIEDDKNEVETGEKK